MDPTSMSQAHRTELHALPGALQAGRGDSAPVAPARLRLRSNEARPQSGQIRSRERVRSLAEVYTNQREVDAMLDLVADMFPSVADPNNTYRTSLEPACGSGNFLVAILSRKLEFVSARRYGRGEGYEHRILGCLASIYGIDISADNVAESRDRLRARVNGHLDRDLGADPVSAGFVSAAEVVLESNIVKADALADVSTIELVEYRPGPRGTFIREWFLLDAEQCIPSLLSPAPRRDEAPVHYSLLGAHPDPVTASEELEGAA
jgi:hypothetical protein